MKLSQIQIDSKAIEGGAWRDAVGLPGVRFHLRGAGNSDWEALQAKLHAELPPAAKFADRIPAENAQAITTELLVGACLLDWEGIEDDVGAALPFAPAKARELLGDPDFRKLRDSVFATAARLSDETIAERDAAAKN